MSHSLEKFSEVKVELEAKIRVTFCLCGGDCLSEVTVSVHLKGRVRCHHHRAE